VPNPALTHPALCLPLPAGRSVLRRRRKQAGFPSAAGGGRTQEHRRQPAGRTPRSASLTRYAARCALTGMPVVPAPRMCRHGVSAVHRRGRQNPGASPSSLLHRRCLHWSQKKRGDGALWRSQRCPGRQALSRGPGGSPPRPHTCCAAACARMGCTSGRSCRRRCARQSGNGGVTGEGALARISPRRRAA